MATAEVDSKIPFTRPQQLVTYRSTTVIVPATPKQAVHNDPTDSQHKTTSTSHLPQLTLPAAYLVREKKLSVVRAIDQNDKSSITSYLSTQLDLTRLNFLQQHFWLAGLEQSARLLHYQLLVGREVVITEAADLHLLWQGSTMYIKPLPDFLLSYDIWEAHLKQDATLHENAVGFLLSCIWLILNPNDLVLAKERDLPTRTSPGSSSPNSVAQSFTLFYTQR